MILILLVPLVLWAGVVLVPLFGFLLLRGGRSTLGCAGTALVVLLVLHGLLGLTDGCIALTTHPTPFDTEPYQSLFFRPVHRPQLAPISKLPKEGGVSSFFLCFWLNVVVGTGCLAVAGLRHRRRRLASLMAMLTNRPSLDCDRHLLCW